MSQFLQAAQRIEDALRSAAQELLPEQALQEKSLVSAAMLRSKLYTEDRSNLSEALPHDQAEADIAVRALFFATSDAPKLFLPLQELEALGLAPQDGPLRILDVGMGVGTMTLAAMAYPGFSHIREFTIDGFDANRAPVAISQRAVENLARQLGKSVQCNFTVARAQEALAATGSYDLIVMGTVLNECDEASQNRIVETALTKLTPRGKLIIIEPALRATTRALHRLRDELLAQARATVLLPCTHSKPCPMLANESDWCHEERQPLLAERTARIAQKTGLRDSHMKFSYLVLAQPNFSHGRLGTLRVVSHMHHPKGFHKATACGAHGLVEVRLLSRHRAESNRSFERSGRGDILTVQPSPEANSPAPRIEITRESELSVQHFRWK